MILKLRNKGAVLMLNLKQQHRQYNIRFKLQQTLTKIVNRGSGNLIAIVL